VVYVAGRVLLIGFVFFVGILLTLGALALVVLILAWLLSWFLTGPVDFALFFSAEPS
jgi:hypothetical protein